MNSLQGLTALKALTHGDPSIKIAVLDGPVDFSHPCFSATATVQPSAAPGMASRHGTAVYSLLFGKGAGVDGIAPGCTGLSIPIYTENENGGFSAASQVKLAQAIHQAVEQGANIINISGGQFSKYGDSEFLLKQAIDKCFKAGVLIVAAAGNDGCYCLHVPAADRQVLAAGSMDENGHPTPETNFGSRYKENGILAPGKDLTAALAGGTTFKTSGATSYATPVVSGIVGLLMSLQIKNGITPDAYAIKSILENTAIPCEGDGKVDCRRFLRGKLNLPAALEAILQNPGVLAAGMDIPMENTAASGDTTTGESTPEHNLAVDVAGNIQETTDGPVAEETTVAEDTHNDTTTTETHSIPLTSEDPAIVPAEMQTDFSANENANPILKKLNNQTMENNTRTQAVEMSSMTETVTPGKSNEVLPADCGCGCGGTGSCPNGGENGGNGGNGGGESTAAQPATLVYALGNLGYDFGSEAHQDSFAQSMGGNPNDPAALIKYLKANPWAAEELTWTLNIDATPIYALYPAGSYSPHVYERLRQYYEQQQAGNIQRISVPGVSQGSTSLLNGHSVINLMPNLRGMYSWTTEALTAAATGAKGSAKALAENVSNFLTRIYYQMRNLGATPEERALNYAATNAYQVSAVFSAALKESLELNDISVNKSPICRPGSDCYDVTLSFFNPRERMNVARKEYRFTIDVSDVVPVTVGEVRAWSVY